MSLFPSTLTGRVLDDGVTEPPVIELQGISAGQLSLVLTQYTPLETTTQNTADIGTNAAAIAALQGQVAALPAAPDLTPYALASDLAAAEGLIAANASGLTAVNTSLTLGLASKANQSALDALQVQVDGKSTPASVDLKLANHPTTAMNSSIASTNNATLATVATTYALKTVVDQLAIDVAARQTAADVDQWVATALLSYLTQTAYQAGQALQDARLDGHDTEILALQNAGPFATAGDLSNLQVTLQSAIDGILAEIATLGGATNLVNAPTWIGNVTWDLLAGTNQIRNLHATGFSEHRPGPGQRRLDPELRLRCVHDPGGRRRHRCGPDELFHEGRSHCDRGGGHRREQDLHGHPAGGLQHHDSDDPGHLRCTGALRDGGPRQVSGPTTPQPRRTLPSQRGWCPTAPRSR